ncbi:MAG: hypothetical protein D6741_18425, partial [Planctomycetota bacterium]
MNQQGLEDIRNSFVDELRQAMDAPALDEFELPGDLSPEARRAAYVLAARLGQCRVFAAKVPEELDGSLEPRMAIAAAEEGAQLAKQWREQAETLADAWDACDPEEADCLCADTLETRMELLFVQAAVEEAYERALWESDEQAGALGEAFDALNEAIGEYDRTLHAPDTITTLATIRELPLLENWRRLLNEEYKKLPPWWLDGTLEAVAD